MVLLVLLAALLAALEATQVCPCMLFPGNDLSSLLNPSPEVF